MFVRVLGLITLIVAMSAFAHDAPDALDHEHNESIVPQHLAQADTDVVRTSGQGDLVFKVFKTNRDLPREALSVLINAHGGFGVDRRPGKGEVYFALPKAGIFKISQTLDSIAAVPTDNQIRDLVLHNTAVWHASGRDFLTFPSVNGFAVYTTSFEGTLLHTLGAPEGAMYAIPAVRDYFNGKNFLVPTDVEVVGNRFYVTTGYSPLDYVLTAKVDAQPDSLNINWTPDAFGGKGTAPGSLDVGHGITLEPGGEALVVADRKSAQLVRYDLEGKYLDTTTFDSATRPCDTDFLGGVTLVACLAGPDPNGAPIHLMRDGEIVSTINPKVDLGLLRFQHVHNAVLIKRENKFYIIAQAWNPGDFAILEQVVD